MFGSQTRVQGKVPRGATLACALASCRLRVTTTSQFVLRDISRFRQPPTCGDHNGTGKNRATFVTDTLLTLIRIFRRVEVRCGGTGAGLRDLAEKNSLGKN